MGVGGQLHAPAALPPGKRPGTHCIGGNSTGNTCVTTTTLDYRYVGRVCAIYSNREEPRMWGLRKMLFSAPAVGAAPAHPHRRATLFVRGLRKTVHTARPLEHAPEAARASPQARACLSELRQGVCYSRLPEGNRAILQLSISLLWTVL
jgi:hypothetical protein